MCKHVALEHKFKIWKNLQGGRGRGRGSASKTQKKTTPAKVDSPRAPLVLDSDSDDVIPPASQAGKRRLPPTLFGGSAGASQATGSLFKRSRR